MDGDAPGLVASNTTYVVLDEADRMLDMGFEPQITKVLEMCKGPGERQTMMFTATWPAKVQAIARQYMGRNVEKVVVDGADEKLVANKNVKQVVHVVDSGEKLDLLKKELKLHFQERKKNQVMIFAATKRKCDELDYLLNKEGFSMAGALHGDRSQSTRDAILNKFRSGRGNVLCATDVAARGIDIPDVKMVVVYDFPHNTEDYIHRIGRTGRAGKTGTALTFIQPDQSAQMPELMQILEDAGSEVPRDVRALAARERKPVWSQKTKHRGGGGHGGSSGNNRFGGGGGGYNQRGGQYNQKSSRHGGYNDAHSRGGGYGNNRGGDRGGYGYGNGKPSNSSQRFSDRRQGHGDYNDGGNDFSNRGGAGRNNRGGDGYGSSPSWKKDRFDDDWDM